MQQQLARSHDFLSQLSGHLNLGDARSRAARARWRAREYAQAYELAANERLDARRASDLARYATATSYAALAEAKLGRDANAFELSEEAIRYESGEAKTWNLYASTMSLLRKPAKAASASRNAVALARRDLAQSPDTRQPPRPRHLPIRAGVGADRDGADERGRAAARRSDDVASLARVRFAQARRRAARSRSRSTPRRAARRRRTSRCSIARNCGSASLYESRGDAARARQQYENVLAARSDDPTALAAIARLSQSGRAFRRGVRRESVFAAARARLSALPGHASRRAGRGRFGGRADAARAHRHESRRVARGEDGARSTAISSIPTTTRCERFARSWTSRMKRRRSFAPASPPPLPRLPISARSSRSSTTTGSRPSNARRSTKSR